MKTGFIGLGHMGSAMAANLVKAGHDVTVFNRSAAPRRALVELGAHEATRVADACGGDAVITMLSDDTALAQVALAEDGIIRHLRDGAIHVSMSTISIGFAHRLTSAHEQAGQRFISAPVLGRPEMAVAAQLFIIAAGDAATISACRPLFDVMGQKTLPIGRVPADANLIKLTANFAIASVIETLGEAAALVGKAGIDPRTLVEVLTSTLFQVPTYRTYGDLIAANRFQPAGFAARLGHKDVRLTLAAAESLRVPMPLAGLLNDRFLRLLAQGGESLDWAAIGGLSAQDAGTTYSAGA